MKTPKQICTLARISWVGVSRFGAPMRIQFANFLGLDSSHIPKKSPPCATVTRIVADLIRCKLREIHLYRFEKNFLHDLFESISSLIAAKKEKEPLE